MEITEIKSFGLEVFGTKEKLVHWLNGLNFALGNASTIELLKDDFGKKMVLKELVNINPGILV